MTQFKLQPQKEPDISPRPPHVRNNYYLLIYSIVIQFVTKTFFEKGNDLATYNLPLYSLICIVSNNSLQR